MIKLKTLLAESGNYIPPIEPENKEGRGWWLSPDAKFYSVYGSTHEHWAKNYLTKRLKLHSYNVERSTYSLMFSSGWVRISLTHMVAKQSGEVAMEFDYGYNYPNRRQISEIRNFAIEKHITKVIDGVKHQDLELMQESSLKEVETFFKAYWMEPDGKTHKVYDNDPQKGHWEWAKEYLKNSGVDSPVYKLFKDGWVRLAFNYSADDILHFTYLKAHPPAARTLKFVKDFGIELGAKAVVDDVTDRPMDLLESINEKMSFRDLSNYTDTDRKERATTVRIRPLKVTTLSGDEAWTFSYKSNPSTTGKRWRGYIKFFKPHVEQSDNAENLDCKVDCECPDFKYRWAYADKQKDASVVGNNSANKALNQPPRQTNPSQTPGLCKHLVGLGKYLKTKINKKKHSNLFESLDELVSRKQFGVFYYD